MTLSIVRNNFEVFLHYFSDKVLASFVGMLVIGASHRGDSPYRVI